jgi:hypothetical protein
MEIVLNTIKDQLKRQTDEMKYSQERVTEYIQTRVKELEEEKPIKHQEK